MRIFFSLLLLICGFQSTAIAQVVTAPELAVASRFGQGWFPGVFTASESLPVRNFRDEIYWGRIEPVYGEYRYSQMTTAYPDLIKARNATLGMILNPLHPGYDNGQTAFTNQGVSAFGAMSADVVRRFPAVTSVEIGNEFNGPDFVSGPVLAGNLGQRATYYAAVLKAAHQSVKVENPNIRVLGGAVLGIPDGYLTKVFDLGAGEFMDALSIHPYTTRPEQLARQIAVLRRLEAARTIPIEVTEYGERDPQRAPGKLMKGYCQLALSGVTRLVWYPLSDRGDGIAPLLAPDGDLTEVGRAFRFLQSELAGLDVKDASPDPFTYACRFGTNKMVIWGEPRVMTLDGNMRAFDPTGLELTDKVINLSMDKPILIISEIPVRLGDNIKLSKQMMLADSYHNYTYPAGDEGFAADDGFQRFTRKNGQENPVVTRAGQDRPGTPWTPFLGDPGDDYVRFAPEYLRPDGVGTAPVEVVHRYQPKKSGRFHLVARFRPSKTSSDGIRITVKINTMVLVDTVAKGEYSFEHLSLPLNQGDFVEFIVGPNGNADGDLTDFRITISQAEG